MRPVFRHVFALFALLPALALASDIKLDAPWVRATAPGQKVAGAFLDVTAPRNARLVGAESPVAKVVELHTMRMENGVMIMRPVPEIALPAGRTVQLKPGGLHIMLIDLNGPIMAGSRVPITLLIQEGSETRRLQVEAEARAPGAAPQHPHRH